MTMMTTEEFISTIQQFTAWEDKYRYLIQQGKTLPVMSEEQKEQATPIEGCESQVWLLWQNKNGQYHFQLDSNARIIKGLLFVILIAIQNKTGKDILDFDFEDYFERMNLLTQLSQSRHNGIQSIINNIKLITKANDSI